VLAAAAMWLAAFLLVSRLLGEEWDGLAGIVGVILSGIAYEFLRSDVRRRAEQHAARIRRTTPPGTPEPPTMDRVLLRRAWRRAELSVLAGALVGTLLTGGAFALAAYETWWLVRAAGIARGDAITTATVADLTDGFSPRLPGGVHGQR
jgi:hypothetical protein